MSYLVHLTNQTVQRNSMRYGSVVKGNILGLSELEAYLKEQQKNSKNSNKPTVSTATLMQRFKHSIGMAFDATFDIVNPNRRVGTFELFGFDFVVDENFHCWLLECNTNPSLEETNEFMSKLLHRMVGRIGII